mmetsp:Transcript_31094/g.78743  ORF Transcript_31094/g.78743 Transcript_31094/m.78743 type:complete len:297 (-) Transcript_31094:66-956(-)
MSFLSTWCCARSFGVRSRLVVAMRAVICLKISFFCWLPFLVLAVDAAEHVSKESSCSSVFSTLSCFGDVPTASTRFLASSSPPPDAWGTSSPDSAAVSYALSAALATSSARSVPFTGSATTSSPFRWGLATSRSFFSETSGSSTPSLRHSYMFLARDSFLSLRGANPFPMPFSGFISAGNSSARCSSSRRLSSSRRSCSRAWWYWFIAWYWFTAISRAVILPRCSCSIASRARSSSCCCATLSPRAWSSVWRPPTVSWRFTTISLRSSSSSAVRPTRAALRSSFSFAKLVISDIMS